MFARTLPFSVHLSRIKNRVAIWSPILSVNKNFQKNFNFSTKNFSRAKITQSLNSTIKKRLQTHQNNSHYISHLLLKKKIIFLLFLVHVYSNCIPCYIIIILYDNIYGDVYKVIYICDMLCVYM